MIENIEIRHEKGEETIYIYLNAYEFAKFNPEKQDFKKELIDTLKKQNLYQRGKKVVLVMGGIILASFLLPFSLQEKIYTYSDPFILEGNKIVEMVKTEPQEKEEKQTEMKNSALKKAKETSSSTKKNTTSKTSTTKKSVTPSKDTRKKETTSTNTASKKETTTVKKTEEKKVTVHRSSGQVVTMTLEEYVTGVVAAEMPASFHPEALKAQAVAARTYALNLLARNKKLTDTTSTQVYKDPNQLKKLWGSSYDTYYKKITNAVKKTKGVVLTYQGKYIYAVYHSTSNGKTEDASEVWNVSYPYLKSVDSSWDKKVSSYQKTVTKNFTELNKILGIDCNETTEIKIIRNDSNRVSEVILAGKKYRGTEFRNLLGLRSADFDITKENDKIKITTKGYGHGVGMSQYGANEMAKQGNNYKKILNHYYTNITFSKV